MFRIYEALFAPQHCVYRVVLRASLLYNALWRKCVYRKMRSLLLVRW